MKIGMTGHQRRSGIDWAWVRNTIETELCKIPTPIVGISSLADGADQMFAEVVLSQGGSLRAIIPTPDYLAYFQGPARERYLALLKHAEVEELEPVGSDEQSFFAAGKRVVDEADLLMAVWDGEPAQGLGGTADVVGYARSCGKPIIHIEPVSRTKTYR